MKRTAKLNGLKSWWNRRAKPQYQTRLTAEEPTYGYKLHIILKG